MAFRFSLQPPKSLLELFERIRELLPQLEPLVLQNVEIETTITAIAHGLGATPRLVRASTPHCLALVCQAAPSDNRCIYLRASNKCVVDVEIIR
jgi:hypothetical protein